MSSKNHFGFYWPLAIAVLNIAELKQLSKVLKVSNFKASKKSSHKLAKKPFTVNPSKKKPDGLLNMGVQ